MTIGENIKKIRKEKQLTQKELAQRLNVSQANLAQYENGKRNPKLTTLQKIADALEVQISVLDPSIGSSRHTPKFAGIMSGTSTLKKGIFNPHLEYSIDLEDIDEIKRANILLEDYKILNQKGQDRILEYVKELIKISEYRKDKKNE